jgi:hypothetical protein
LRLCEREILHHRPGRYREHFSSFEFLESAGTTAFSLAYAAGSANVAIEIVAKKIEIKKGSHDVQKNCYISASRPLESYIQRTPNQYGGSQ